VKKIDNQRNDVHLAIRKNGSRRKPPEGLAADDRGVPLEEQLVARKRRAAAAA